MVYKVVWTMHILNHLFSRTCCGIYTTLIKNDKFISTLVLFYVIYFFITNERIQFFNQRTYMKMTHYAKSKIISVIYATVQTKISYYHA